MQLGNARQGGAQRRRPPLIVYLVHGTFASEAEWVAEEALVGSRIKSVNPDATLRSFRWSGENSHRARSDAGEALSKEIVGALKSQRSARVVIVGHSHGGNVALYAQRSDEAARATVGIACLGTPFFAISRREPHLANPVAFAASALGFLGLTVGSIMILAGAGEAVLGALGAVLGTVIAVPVIGLYLKNWYDIQTWLRTRIEAALRRWGEKELPLIAFPTPRCPTYVASVALDEAGAGLRLWDELAIAPWRIFALLAEGVVIAVATLFAIASLAALTMNAELGDRIGDSLIRAVLLMIIVGALAPIPAALFGTGIRSGKLAFGPERIGAFLSLRVRPTREPWWIEAPLSRRKAWSVPWRRWLRARTRHSFFYEDEQVADELAQWISTIRDRERAMMPAKDSGSGRRGRWPLLMLPSILLLLICAWEILLYAAGG